MKRNLSWGLAAIACAGCLLAVPVGLMTWGQEQVEPVVVLPFISSLEFETGEFSPGRGYVGTPEYCVAVSDRTSEEGSQQDELPAKADPPVIRTDVTLVEIGSVSPDKNRFNVIWDDDGDPSGVLALLFFLVHPQFEVIAATISPGEADPPVYAGRLALMMERLGVDIPVAYGPSQPAFGDHTFPPGWRDFVNGFFGLDLCGTFDCHAAPITVIPTGSADLLIADLLETQACQADRLVLFASGPLTNVYQAYLAWQSVASTQQIEDVATNCLETEIMGGAINVPGNLGEGVSPPPNHVAEWNIWIDPVAAEEVFHSPDVAYLTPLDVTNQVLWSMSDVAELRSIDTCEADLAASLLQALIESIGYPAVYAWDIDAAALAALRLAEGGSVTINGRTWNTAWNEHCIDVATSGPNEGGMSFGSGPHKTRIYEITSADAESLKQYVISIFAQTAP